MSSIIKHKASNINIFERLKTKNARFRFRIDYMREHVKAMSEAIDEGVDLMGYTWWGCIDLVSVGTGEIRKRYGFIYVDVDDFGNGTYKRYKKDSFEYCKKVYTSNGKDID